MITQSDIEHFIELEIILDQPEKSAPHQQWQDLTNHAFEAQDKPAQTAA